MELEQHHPSILADDRGIVPAKRRVHLSYLAGEIPEHIDEVHTGLEDEQLRHGAKVWLTVEVGARPPSVAHARAARDCMHRPNRVRIEQPPQLAMPGLETEIVVHHLQPDARVFRCIHERLGILERRGQWLLAKNILDAVLSSQATDLRRVAGVIMSMKSGRSVSSIAATSV